jgi:hypothetical protein
MRPPAYEAGMLTTRPRRSLTFVEVKAFEYMNLLATYICLNNFGMRFFISVLIIKLTAYFSHT